MSDGPPLQTREEIEDLERQIERLRVMYQQYFMGTLKQEPLTLRKSIYRLVLQAKPGQVRNTGARFKLRNLIQKWNGYLNMWKRTVRQMEEGTYRRDLERVRRRGRAMRASDAGAPVQAAEQASEQEARQPVVEVSDDLSAAELDAQLQAAMVQEVAQTKTPPPRSHTPNSQAADKRLVERIMERQAQGLSLDGLDLDELTGD